MQSKFRFSLTNEQRGMLNGVSLGHFLLVSGQARTRKSTLFVLQNEILCKCMFNEKQCNLLIFLFTAATFIAIFFIYIIHKKTIVEGFFKRRVDINQVQHVTIYLTRNA